MLWVGVVIVCWLVVSVVAGTLFALAAAARHRHGPDRVIGEVVPVVLPWQRAPVEHRTGVRR